MPDRDVPRPAPPAARALDRLRLTVVDGQVRLDLQVATHLFRVLAGAGEMKPSATTGMIGLSLLDELRAAGVRLPGPRGDADGHARRVAAEQAEAALLKRHLALRAPPAPARDPADHRRPGR